MTLKSLSASLLASFTLITGSCALTHAAEVTDFPNKPIRIIVPFPPGGSNDLLARYFGDKLTERLGQQTVIDNRGGANGIIGTQIAAAATPDGYTALAISVSYTMNAAVRKLPYDVVKSFDPISMFGTNSNCIVTSPTSGLNSVKEIISRAKAKPGALSYASTGVGGFNHFGGELFKKIAGVDIVHVPYKGGGPAMIDVMGGQIPLMFSTVTQVLPHVRTSRLKIIAVGADKRSPVVPEVPTFAEAGLPGYEVYGWWGISAPAGVPPAVRGRLTKVFSDILRDPGTRKRLEAEAAEPRDMAPEEMRTFIREEVKKWTEIAKNAGIHVK
jgi:tripartite-type tricarboxylate transporter receptor subunit TctC